MSSWLSTENKNFCFCFLQFYFTIRYPSSDFTFLHAIRYSKFQNVASITLHFPDSFGGDTTKIEYIGFKGEATQVIAHIVVDFAALVLQIIHVLGYDEQLKRDVVATIVYELRPNPSDHK